MNLLFSKRFKSLSSVVTFSKLNELVICINCLYQIIQQVCFSSIQIKWLDTSTKCQ